MIESPDYTNPINIAIHPINETCYYKSVVETKWNKTKWVKIRQDTIKIIMAYGWQFTLVEAQLKIFGNLATIFNLFVLEWKMFYQISNVCCVIHFFPKKYKFHLQRIALTGWMSSQISSGYWTRAKLACLPVQSGRREN